MLFLEYGILVCSNYLFLKIIEMKTKLYLVFNFGKLMVSQGHFGPSGLVWGLSFVTCGGHFKDKVLLQSSSDMRKVEILPQTDFLGFTISSKWGDSRPDKFPQKLIICGNFYRSMPGTRLHLKKAGI